MKTYKVNKQLKLFVSVTTKQDIALSTYNVHLEGFQHDSKILI